MSTSYPLTSSDFLIPSTKILVRRSVSLKEEKATTFRIGGPAQFFARVFSAADLEAAVSYAVSKRWPVTVLGGGSNTLISDKGVQGLVLIYSSRNFVLGEEKEVSLSPVPPRHASVGEEYYSTVDLDYVDTGLRQEITLDAGMTLALAISRTHQVGLTGLCHFGGIPGTLGGALYNNAHGGKKHFSDYFVSAEILEITGPEVIKKTVDASYFQLGYDQSRLRENSSSRQIIVLRVTLSLFRGDVAAAKTYAQTYLRRKKEKQPWNSAGCVFQNLTSLEQAKIGTTNPSWGLVTDKFLGWKGKRCGQAVISPLHASFIVNEDYGASAQDVLALMKLIKREFFDRYGVSLRPEIKFLGFSESELAFLFE